MPLLFTEPGEQEDSIKHVSPLNDVLLGQCSHTIFVGLGVIERHTAVRQLGPPRWKLDATGLHPLDALRNKQVEENCGKSVDKLFPACFSQATRG